MVGPDSVLCLVSHSTETINLSITQRVSLPARLPTRSTRYHGLRFPRERSTTDPEHVRCISQLEQQHRSQVCRLSIRGIPQPLLMLTDARIQNPLAGIPKDILLAQVEDFSQEKGLTEILPLLEKGALISQNPLNFEEVEGLDHSELEALRNETAHKWRQPRALYFTVILCSIGACVQ